MIIAQIYAEKINLIFRFGDILLAIGIGSPLKSNDESHLVLIFKILIFVIIQCDLC